MATPKAKWTVMVYLAGDNNLTTECLFALTEMKKADPGNKINVIAQFDPRDTFLPTLRYEINRAGSKSSLLEDIIDDAKYDLQLEEVRFGTESTRAETIATLRKDYRDDLKSALPDSGLNRLLFEEEEPTDDTDTGSPVTLYNFLSFCVQSYPADHYLVVLSGHAGGTDSDYLLTDESPRGSLTFNEMKEVFAELQKDLNGEKIDIIGMDNCLMSMAEICYELRDFARVLVGCESYSPASGWPYRQIIERLKANVDSSGVSRESVCSDVGKAIVEEYVNYYSDYWLSGMSVAQSALDLRRADAMKLVIDRLSTVLDRELTSEDAAGNQSFRDALVLAHWEAQSYNGEWFVDLFDFCDCLEKRVENEAVVEVCREVKRFISEEFVLKSCYSGAAFQYSYGVSIYFPWSQVASKYENLELVKVSNGTGWFDFLKTYVSLTRRKPRGLSDQSNPNLQTDDFVTAARIASDRIASDRIASDRITSDRIASDRIASDRIASDRIASDRMLSGGCGNPIRSMRNPPVSFVLTKCAIEK